MKHTLSDVDRVILKAKIASIKKCFDPPIRDRVVVTLTNENRLVVTLKKEIK